MKTVHLTSALKKQIAGLPQEIREEVAMCLREVEHANPHPTTVPVPDSRLHPEIRRDLTIAAEKLGDDSWTVHQAELFRHRLFFLVIDDHFYAGALHFVPFG